jgi:hypothetical protein
MVIDEIQRVPELLLAIKEQVDADPRPGRYLLSLVRIMQVKRQSSGDHEASLTISKCAHTAAFDMHGLGIKIKWPGTGADEGVLRAWWACRRCRR